MWDLFLPIHTNAYLKVENMPAIGFEIKRKCKVCGEVFLAKTLDSQYCSPKCSKVAWKRKKDAKEKNEKLDRLAQHIPDIREYVSVKEAVAMFGVERTTLYRLIKNGTVPAINVGKRLTRIKRSALETMFLTRKEIFLTYPWYWIKRMYRSDHFRQFLVVCMACTLAVSVFLTIFLAYDNALLRKVNNIICKV